MKPIRHCLRPLLCLGLSLSFSLSSYAVSDADAQNTSISSFSKAKRVMLEDVYYDHRRTIYCNAKFSMDKKIDLPNDLSFDKHKNRAGRVEWEHVVPAENFGRAFVQWREGDPACVNKSGKEYKGRRCAQKTSKRFRYMESDLYNLYPAIGAVNALRSNYQFAMIGSPDKTFFDSCEMIIGETNKTKLVQPPKDAMGRIARTYLYMDDAYSEFRLSNKLKNLFEAWDRMYPVDAWECKRASRIEKIQGNPNPFVQRGCQQLSGELDMSPVARLTDDATI